MVEPGDEPSRRVVEQRIRNQIIDYLELAASFEAQQEYERSVPIAHVPYEVINQWQDSVPRDPRAPEFDPAVYSGAEVEAILTFHRVWSETSDAVPDDYPSLAEVQQLAEWHRLRDEALTALAIFARRGRLDEDRIDVRD